MVANQNFTRIGTSELKTVMYRKVGHQRAEKYFDLLKRFFSFKLGKYEFDKSCIRTIGKENISLHNQLIRSILKNLILAKVPPLRVKKVANGHQRHILQSIHGEALPPSPRKGRSLANRDRRFRDRPSPLGPLGKSPNIMLEEVGPRALEQQSATELHSLGSRPPVEVASVEDGEEVEQAAGSPSIQSRSPVMAPLGISMKIGGAHKTLCSGSLYKLQALTCQNTCELPDARSLKTRLEQKLEAEGLGISVECANLLNNGLDCYLKRLIEPCMGLAGFQQITASGRYMERPSTASMLDFRVALESTPRLLGGDWAVQLEKVCSRAFEE